MVLALQALRSAAGRVIGVGVTAATRADADAFVLRAGQDGKSAGLARALDAIMLPGRAAVACGGTGGLQGAVTYSIQAANLHTFMRLIPRPGAPSPRRQLANFVVFEAAWFACILAVAHGLPLWGTAAILAAIAWHVAASARPAVELALVGLLAAIGLVAESLVVAQGHVAYANGQPVAWLAPYWMVALWAEFAIALNVTLRWLKGRPLLAMVLGAVCGPLSFVGGVRLGGARFIDQTAALTTLACMWALLMPLVMWLSSQLDGVVVPPSRTDARK